ncbi:hypothetical protein FEZ48_00205 [Marinilactibacillus psychrotolerans]|uniref:Uncharacterized protein n=2 Tax=Marinilactibacillus psychrotolerans TaxID=191770 RepID=A0A5R9C8R6_9LACT|nr:hypothetical protein FEZ48_00205 [Marinilactibacillus psychrotolerans]
MSELLTPLTKEEDWVHAKSVEYMWLALILYQGERTTHLEKCMNILRKMSDSIDEKHIETPSLTNILLFSKENQEIFTLILKEEDVLNSLAPISLVLDDLSLFKKELRAYQFTVEERLDKLNLVLEELSDHQSQLSTDIRYLLLYQYIMRGKILFNDSQKEIMDGLKDYPYLNIENERMRFIRPTIRSMEIGISQTFGRNNSFSKSFWKSIGQYTECEIFSIKINENKADLTFIKNKLYKVLKYYQDILQNVRQIDEKLFVLVCILTYSYKRLLELVEHDMQQTISGRSIIRSCIENYMMTKYLLKNEDKHENVWEEFQYYGIGNYKLIFERYREGAPNLGNTHVNFDYLNILVSEYINKEFIEMDTKYFGRGNIRKKFEEVNEESLYKYFYEYDSQYEHGLWGAIRESSVLKCNAPGHQYHGIPDVDNIQNLPDVGYDAIDILEKHLAILISIYPLPFGIQDEEANIE